ncbi:MAG TPA: bifunctional transaldolase/phosoglucose isomerase [Thermoleophilaceae bacterium]|nr:bifunctional transaldolase/phosoglucose isomerase [Thermoleophilaceae bacterium]
MAVTSQQNERLAALTEAGTAVWLDQIRRSLIESGELQRLVEEDSLRGVTSNPAIFEKAILGSDDYDEDIEKLAKEGLTADEIYLDIAVKDVQLACDVLRPVWDELSGADGFVSLEVEPSLAHDTDGTRRQARELWDAVDRPNVLIKIPGTEAGLEAIEDSIADGINVNVTLLFSVESYEAVTERFITGLERRHQAGDSLDVHSVASFFVSRVDSEVDKRLEKLGREDLKGQAAIANAQAAYQSFKRIFHGERFAELREAGAYVQRPLWASTGVKDPNYPETKYVDGLVAPETVNTMPMPTLLAAAEKAEIKGATADQDPSKALKALAEAGIDMGDVTKKLLEDGIAKFVEPFDQLIAGVESSKEAAIMGRPPRVDSSIPDELEGPLAERVKTAVEENVARRIWRKDETLWGGPGPEIGDRLGWLTISETMLEHVDDLGAFVDEVKADGFTHAALLGMGGSSLGPEVIRRSFGKREGGLELHVLDSTDPEAVRALEEAVDLDKTLFVVSSKSGGTVETLSHMRYFYERTGGNGAQFVAVTDPGSGLVEIAGERGFRRVFENDPNIGGRYSVMSYFGLVPAALMGVDVEALLQSSREAEENCNSFDDSFKSRGMWMGLAIGELARQGRDKLTFVVSDPVSSFGLWAEQLIAESTGKEGTGILPVAGEPLGDPESYGDDRVFAYLKNEQDPDEDHEAATGALRAAGQPVLVVPVKGPEDLGRIFFFAEFATAVAGWVLGINAFDQPNVQEAKDNTAKLLEADEAPVIEDADDDALRELLAQAEPPRYVAIFGYVAPSDEFDEAVAELRAAIRDATKATTTFGYGPRYLHSTGQFHKGGPPSGLFLQLLHEPGEDIEIPEAGYSFQTLKEAQATGDILTLRDHGLPAERARLDGDPAQAVRELTERVRGLLSAAG